MTSQEKIKKIVKELYLHGDKPFEMTDGQALIFLDIIDPRIKWLWLSAPTRYGKSDILAMALLYLAAVKKIKVPIVAGSEEKARKIMDYVVGHVSDNVIFYQGLVNTDISKVEQLKVSVSKTGLRWHDGGWIHIASVDSRSVKRKGEGVVGEGGDCVVLEEAGLIKDKEQFSKIVRMPEENNGWGKLIMSGNCIEKSVFHEAYNNELYKKNRVTLEQSVAEGRYTWEALEDKKTQTTSKDWKSYYEVRFPKVGEFAYFKPQSYEYLPTEVKYYGAFDPALGESGKEGSLVGLCIGAIDYKGQAYEVESYGMLCTPDEAIKKILNLPYTFERFGIESVQFQKYFLQVIERESKARGKYIPFTGIQQQRKKEERIESMEPAVNTGQVLLKGDGILWDHMQEYPDIEKLDVLDTFEMLLRLMGITGKKKKARAFATKAAGL